MTYLSAKLAKVLEGRRGDVGIARCLWGRAREVAGPVLNLAEDFPGTAAYIELHALNRLLLEGDRISGAHVVVDRARWAEFTGADAATPRLAGRVLKAARLRGLRLTPAVRLRVA